MDPRLDTTAMQRRLYPHLKRMTRRQADGSVQQYTYHRRAKQRIYAPYGTAAFDAEYRAIQSNLAPPPRAARRTFIYAISARETGHIKVGKATSPTKRLRELQTACPDELELLGVIVDASGGLLERVLHERFAESHLRGEWFRPCDDLLAWIAAETSPSESEAVSRFDNLKKAQRSQ